MVVSALPGLLAQPADVQVTRLRAVSLTPVPQALATFDATGRALARTDGRPLEDVGGTRLYAAARASEEPVVDLVTLTDGPVVRVASRVLDAQGAFDGLVVIELERLVAPLAPGEAGPGARISLLHPDGRSPSSLSSGLSTVGAEPGALAYGDPADRWLAGYAPVPVLGSTLVVERPAALALEEVRGWRERTLILLLAAASLAVAAGVAVARRLAHPLAALAAAAERVGAGEELTGSAFATGSTVRLDREAFARQQETYSAEMAPLVTRVLGGAPAAGIALPLRTLSGAVVGVLALASTHGEMTADDEALLEGLAAQVAIALRNADLYAQAQRQSRELRAALETLRETQAQVVQQERLRAVGQMASGIAHDFE